MNTNALNRAFSLSKKGSNVKSKLLLLIIGVLNQASSFKKTNAVLRKISAVFSNKGNLNISIKEDGKLVPFSVRLDNNSDYQSLFECFCGMYQMPATPVKYVLDGGANIGFFSINIFMESKSIQEIICVEPNPANLEFLIPNTKNLPAKIINAAMADFSGTATFNFKEHNTGHIEGSPGHAYFNEQTVVNCVTIADIIPGTWQMESTLVKLDIEGQEYNVFKDMFKVGIFPKYIAAELHDYLYAGGEQLVDTMRNYGYEVLVEGTGDQGNVCRQIFAERKK